MTDATCAVCAGRIYQTEIVRGHPSGDWLHVNEADWIDNPHNAEPVREPGHLLPDDEHWHDATQEERS